jgi:hypothetical protein
MNHPFRSRLKPRLLLNRVRTQKRAAYCQPAFVWMFLMPDIVQDDHLHYTRCRMDNSLALATAWVRLLAPSLPKMLRTWALTV